MMVYNFKLVKISILTRSDRPDPPHILNHKNLDTIGFCTVKVLNQNSVNLK